MVPRQTQRGDEPSRTAIRLLHPAGQCSPHPVQGTDCWMILTLADPQAKVVHSRMGMRTCCPADTRPTNSAGEPKGQNYGV